MRTAAARAGIAVAGLAAAVVLFLALSDGGDEGTGTAPSGQRTAQDAIAAEAPQPRRGAGERDARPARSARRTPERPTVARIVVRGGRPVGGVRRLAYERGDRVRFSVRSDVAEEVHVHGFDLAKEVAAGGSVRFDFAADIEGIFEVELEHSGTKIAEVRVRP